MLALQELTYISDCISRNATQDSERALAAMLHNTQDMLCCSQGTDDLQELGRLLSCTLAHPVVRNVLANTSDLTWDGETGIAIAYLAWIAQLFQQAWDSSFSNVAAALAALAGTDDSMLKLRVQLQQWQQASPLRLVSAEWLPHKHFLLDLVAIFAIWSMTVIGIVEVPLYPKVASLLQYEQPFILAYLACACMSHRNMPCVFGTLDGAAWNHYDSCHSLIQRFEEVLKDNE